MLKDATINGRDACGLGVVGERQLRVKAGNGGGTCQARFTSHNFTQQISRRTFAETLEISAVSENLEIKLESVLVKLLLACDTHMRTDYNLLSGGSARTHADRTLARTILVTSERVHLEHLFAHGSVEHGRRG